MKLLVSVVSGVEAERAVRGGADIIDVKDPAEGALGAPAPRMLEAVIAAVAGRRPVSVALGDLPDLPHSAALAARGAAACGADVVKVGLRGTVDPARAAAVMRAVRDAVGPRVGVIAAAYADGARLDPPALPPETLPEVVRLAGLTGCLVDTMVKDGSGLWASLPEPALLRLAREAAVAGSLFGVAGQLRRGELSAAARVAACVDAAVGDASARSDARARPHAEVDRLSGSDDAETGPAGDRESPPDPWPASALRGGIVGVRSAVCAGGDRGGELSAELVAAVLAELRAATADPAHPPAPLAT